MRHDHPYTLTPAQVAEHYALRPATIRAYLRDGRLRGVRVAGAWRLSWPDVWALERGPMPRGPRADAYRHPLLTKNALAASWGVSTRTVERWIADGLPTRDVLGSVRVAPADAERWIEAAFGAPAGTREPR